MAQEYKILDLKLYLFVKVFRWFLFALFAVGCELSVEGRGFSRSYFTENNYPLGSYLLTWTAMFLVLVLIVQSYFTRFYRKMVITEEAIVIQGWLKQGIFKQQEVKDLWLVKSFDYPYDNCYELTFMVNEKSMKVVVILEDDLMVSNFQKALSGFHFKVFKN